MQSLCSICSTLSVSRFVTSEQIDHLDNIRDLPRSAHNCDLCALIQDEVLENSGALRSASRGRFKDVDEVLEELGSRPGDGLGVGLSLELEDGILTPRLQLAGENGKPVGYTLGRHGLRIFSNATSGNHDLPIGKCIAQMLDLDNLAALVERWTNECSLSHTICATSTPEDEMPLPTRLLEIADHGQSIKLVRSRVRRGRYVALSHCWGIKKPIETTKAILGTHEAGINAADFTKTFQDAVRVARSLQLRYLWIDSLCIVQDDPADWEREAVLMGDVYGNAYITIAASRADGSDTGFLHARNEDKVVKIRTGDFSHVYIGTRYSFADDVDNAPLNDRAWVIQERVLSRRTLHFTDNQVYWECWERHQGENLMDKKLGVFKQNAYPQILAPGLSAVPNQIDTASTPRQWWHLLSSYTAKKLTYQKDRLVAISGLIDRITKTSGQRSFAGVFNDTLHAGVLWAATDGGLPLQQERKYPSWSWASRARGINNIQLYDYIANSEEVALTTTNINGSATLAVKHRSLRRDIIATDMKLSSDYDAYPPELDYLPTKFRFLAPAWSDDDDDFGWLVLDDDHGSEVNLSELGFAVIVSVADEDNPDENIEAVVASAGGNELFWKGPFYCLVLQHASAEKYIRIGVGYIPGMKWFTDGSTNANIM